MMRVEQIIEQRLGWFNDDLISVVTIDGSGEMTGWLDVEPFFDGLMGTWISPISHQRYAMGKIYNYPESGRESYYEVSYE